MDLSPFNPPAEEALQKVLGYLNFSSGAPDPQFLANLNLLFRYVWLAQGKARAGKPAESQVALGEAADAAEPGKVWRQVGQVLHQGLERLRGQSEAFRDSAQAGAVIQLVWDQVLPGYLEFHRDLLFHQTPEDLFQPFFVGRACEAALQQGLDLASTPRLVAAIIARLNDYLGHRPVATLQTHKHEPYAHEWVRPIPLWVQGAGAADGRYREVVERALLLLGQTSPPLLRQAHFDPAALEELAVDPRAYDFDHPVNKRPNYHFGQWDPHHIDNSGRYRRFVVQQVTFDALMQRLEQPSDLPREELLFEAAAVLAGIVLMAAGISGTGPGTYDSNTTLVKLLPRIAAYRDAFYEELIERMEGVHAERLWAEAKRLRQPFGGARQHLNAQLARRRAIQLEHVHLAKIFARMGYPEAASRQAGVVPVASARMLCQIDCLLSFGHQAVEAGRAGEAAEQLAQIIQLLRRAIECGAVVDPWNILGFDAHYSLFPAVENSVRDHRVDELIELMEQIFNLYARIWSDAAAADDLALCQRMADEFRKTAQWWQRFAAHEVSSVDAVSALEAYEAAEHVARALNLWHKAGAAAGDVRFWAPHAEMFDSPKAYALVIEALLDRGDFVSSLALLVGWLGQAERISLQQGESSFITLATRWMHQLKCQGPGQVVDRRRGIPRGSAAAMESEDAAVRWALVRRLFDFFEANAEEYWRVPKFQLGGSPRRDGRSPQAADRPVGDLGEGDEGEGDEDDLFRAAYENVVYRDSTDDGVEGEVFETGSASDDELERESRRIGDRLAFLECLAKLWKLAAVMGLRQTNHHADVRQVMVRWSAQAEAYRRKLLELIDAVAGFAVPLASADHEALVEYDRRRMIKDNLLEQIISSSVEVSDAARFILSAVAALAPAEEAPQAADLPADLEPDQRQAVLLGMAVFRGNVEEARRRFDPLVAALRSQALLYVPLAKGGDPRKIAAARIRQRTIHHLLTWLPRLGLLSPARELIETARLMEQENPAGPGSVTEFDDLFSVGYQRLVEALIASAQLWETQAVADDPDEDTPDAALVGALEQMTQAMIESWLAHSRTLRLSVLEQVSDDKKWKQLVAFIRRYGGDLFSQRFLHLANLRAILHQGVESWLSQLEAEPHRDEEFQLLEVLDRPTARRGAVKTLTLILEAVVENYVEYRDYNATTTQSDRGEMLYMLLDFLRLRVAYDRVSWNLKPVILAHETLVRHQRNQAAELWRRALAERFRDEADRFLDRLGKLQKKYAMRMPTVADRLGERFMLPMTIDRVCALVEPAIREAGGKGHQTTFDLLEQEANMLAQEPTGAGLDAPQWLMLLEDEVERVRRPYHLNEDFDELSDVIPQAQLSLEEVQQELDSWLEDDEEEDEP